jgi:hypothetical protein
VKGKWSHRDARNEFLYRADRSLFFFFFFSLSFKADFAVFREMDENAGEYSTAIDRVKARGCGNNVPVQYHSSIQHKRMISLFPRLRARELSITGTSSVGE